MIMSKENNLPATKQDADKLRVITLPKFESREQFQARLASKPEKTKKEYKSMSVPIGIVENTLDDIYQGLWSTRNLVVQSLGGSLNDKGEMQGYFCVSIDLVVIDPAGIEIVRSGVASGYILHNNMKTHFAALKSMAIKNAAKSLGDAFGRDLNRDDDTISEKAVTTADKKEAFENVKADLAALHSEEEVQLYFRDEKVWKSAAWFKNLCNARAAEIKSEAKPKKGGPNA